MKYGFIGTGNMAQTMIQGMVAHQGLVGDDVYAVDHNPDKVAAMVDVCGIHACSSAEEVIACSDVVVIAVKPHQSAALLSENANALEKSHPILLWLPVGISLAQIRDQLGFDNPIVRIIPNISAEVAASVTALCANAEVAVTDKASLIQALESIGPVIDLAEKYLDIFTIIASSGPAFVIRFAESLVEGALREGLPKATARQIVTAMLAGTAKVMAGNDPYSLIDRICSPGGTTIAGLTSLTAHGFEASVHAAVADAYHKLRSEGK